MSHKNSIYITRSHPTPLIDRSLTRELLAITAMVSSIGISGGSAHAAALDIPSGSAPSPLCIEGKCAVPFTARMVLFEEFGLQPMPSPSASPDPNTAPHATLPTPLATVDDPFGCRNVPDGGLLDDFLSDDLYPSPTELADGDTPSPWDTQIKSCVTGVDRTVQDGRPVGEWFGHQRWSEFKAESYFQSAMSGARVNGGLRDKIQLHDYKKGEFALGGLYHNTVYSPGDVNLNPAFNGSTKGIPIKIHPNLPTQDPKSVWTFDGTLPPKLLMARVGEPVLFRHYNALPIDFGANNGFGANTISTHEHNGHNPGESDGFAHAYFYPGQFYDYHWPMVLAGHDSVNTAATDPKAGAPDGAGGIKKIPGDPGELASTHWFHDHMLDYTSQNVYKGNAAMMNIYSSVDRGNEALNDGVNLRFPSGTAMDWGNRDYDVNLVVADKAWDDNGQLFFNIFNKDGFLGDRMTVNWIYKPYMDVRARRYRFRILNGAVARYMKIAIVDDRGVRVPFHMIANDGNIMEHAVYFPNSQSQDLPTQAIAERWDIVIDFAGKNVNGQSLANRKVYFVNTLEHVDGRGPNRVIPLADAWGNSKKPYVNDATAGGDPAIGAFMEFRIKPLTAGQVDLSMKPGDYEEFARDAAGKVTKTPGKKMVPRPKFSATDLANARHRTFEFGRSNNTDELPWTIKTDGGVGLTADPHRVSAAPAMGAVEIWHLKATAGGWSHPAHIHFEEGQVLARGGVKPPVWEKWARKDIYRVGGEAESTFSVDVALRVREFYGTYVEHCHNTTHEDHAMLLRWDIEDKDHVRAIPTPMTDWNGSFYEPSVKLPTAITGDPTAAAAFRLP